MMSPGCASRSRGRHSFRHPGKGSAWRQTAVAQRQLQGRGRRSREEIDLRLMTRGSLRQRRRVEPLVGAARQEVHLSAPALSASSAATVAIGAVAVVSLMNVTPSISATVSMRSFTPRNAASPRPMAVAFAPPASPRPGPPARCAHHAAPPAPMTSDAASASLRLASARGGPPRSARRRHLRGRLRRTERPLPRFPRPPATPRGRLD